MNQLKELCSSRTKKTMRIYSLALSFFILMVLSVIDVTSVYADDGNGATSNSLNPSLYLPFVSSSVPNSVSENSMTGSEFIDAVNQIEQYITITANDQLELVIPDASTVENIAPDTLTQLMQSLEHTNALIRDGSLILNDVKLRTTDEPSVSAAHYPCEGRSDLESYWWGTIAYLDSCETSRFQNDISNIVWGLGPFAPLCRWVRHLGYICVTAGVLGTFERTIQWTQKGNGVSFHWSHQSPSILPVVRAQ